MKKLQFLKSNLNTKRKFLAALTAVIMLAFISMSFTDYTSSNKSVTQVGFDTLPKNKDADIDVDMQHMQQNIEKSMDKAQESLKNIDWNKISKEAEQSLQKIDMQKIQLDVDKSLKSIDWNKIKNEIDISMRNIDRNKIKLDIENAMTEVRRSLNSEEFRKSMDEIKNINMDEIKKEMAKVKVDLKLNRAKINSALDKAKLEVLKAKKGLKEVKQLTIEMEKDGLINKDGINTIEYKNKELFINGKKQSQKVTEKYRKYFKEDNFKIRFNGTVKNPDT